jgi:outer membrane protein assembly factor BamA
LGAVELRNELADQRAGESTEALAPLRALQGNAPYSQEKLERAREALAGLRVFRVAKEGGAPPEVDVSAQFYPEARTVRAVFRVHEGQPYTVRRVEFVGLERFSDRYYRRRVQLKEGELLDTAKLESSLARLARAGFIHPVKKEDIRLKLDEQLRTVDVIIRIEEIGRQRVSLVGGHGGLGETLGLVYNVFDLFGGEELITAHLEGGPDSLQMLLGVAKEGVFGTRASLGLSLFQNVVRPNLPGRQRLFTSRSSGFALGSSYQLTPRDALGFNYQLSRSSTQYHLDLPSSISGLVNNQLRAATSSHSLGMNAEHDSGSERLTATASVSGGWLGGNENLLRSSLEYSRLLPDPFGSAQGGATRRTWAFRGYLSGVSSYRGELPLQARLFPGDELVRGFRTGELGPYALVKTAPAGGTASGLNRLAQILLERSTANTACRRRRAPRPQRSLTLARVGCCPAGLGRVGPLCLDEPMAPCMARPGLRCAGEFLAWNSPCESIMLSIPSGRGMTCIFPTAAGFASQTAALPCGGRLSRFFDLSSDVAIRFASPPATCPPGVP